MTTLRADPRVLGLSSPAAMAGVLEAIDATCPRRTSLTSTLMAAEPAGCALMLRESAVASFREQVAELARLDPVDDDLDVPAGFFLLSDERQQSTSWTVRDGLVIETLAPGELHWFAERP